MAVYQWIKALGEEIAQLNRHASYIVELDELHSYVGHKKTIAGSGLLLIDLANVFSMESLEHAVPYPGHDYGRLSRAMIAART